MIMMIARVNEGKRLVFSAREWVAQAIAYAEMSQTELAEKLAEAIRIKVDKTRISKMINGKRDIAAYEIVAISEITGYPLPNTEVRTVPITHVVTTGGVIVGIDGAVFPDIVIPNLIRDRAVCAAIVSSEEVSRVWTRGTVLLYAEPEEPGVRTEDIGSPCVVQLEDGQTIVAQVRRADEPGLFNLIALSNSYDTRWNQRIAFCSKVEFALPSHLATTGGS